MGPCNRAHVYNGNTNCVFSESDPLHVKMIQVINLARSDYETAKRLAAGGKNEQAAGYLQSAEEKLLHVTKPFPLNQDLPLRGRTEYSTVVGKDLGNVSLSQMKK